MAVVAGRGAADDRAFAIEQRLVAQWIGIRDTVNLESDEAMRYSRLLLLFEGLFADKRTLVEAYEAVQSRFVRRVVGGEVAAPHAVGFLEPQGFHRTHARHPDVEFGAGGEQRVE